MAWWLRTACDGGAQHALVLPEDAWLRGRQPEERLIDQLEAVVLVAGLAALEQRARGDPRRGPERRHVGAARVLALALGRAAQRRAQLERLALLLAQPARVPQLALPLRRLRR